MDPNETDTHIEPAAEALVDVSNTGALAALEAYLSGEPAPVPAQPDPKPGDALPPPDSAPRAPEGDGESDPDDNAPPSDPPKPDDKKTVVPTPDSADDPTTPPLTPGAPKRPSDEFGELPKDAKAETRERFETMKTKYDGLSQERDNYRDQASKWVETVQSTGATPDQFGMALGYLKAVNAGTPEGLNEAYEMMLGELQTIAKALGKDIPGIVDPLEDFPDLKARVDDDEATNPLTREDALQIAQSRRVATMRQEAQTQTQQSQAQTNAVNAGLTAVKAFGEGKRVSDPLFAQKTAAIKPLVERVVANLPPDQWLGAVQELYANANVAAPPHAPTQANDPPLNTPLRPTSVPGPGGNHDKTPGSAYEAVDMMLKSL